MTPRRARIGRAFSWLLAVVALGFVAWSVPVRDRCWDEGAPASTKVSVSRSPAGCVLHLRSGDVAIDAPSCARLECEPGLASTLDHVRPGILAALLAVYAAGTLAWAVRWRALLRFAGLDLPVREVWRISVEAQAGGVVLPGGIGGDALRIASILARPALPGRARAPAAIVVASVLLDRAVGLALIATAAVVLGWIFGGMGGGSLAVVLAGLPLGIAAGLLVLRRAPIHRIPWLSRGRLGRVVEPVLAYVRDPRAPRAIALAAVASAMVACAQFVVLRGLVYALGAAPAHERWVYIGSAMALIVAAIPALPGGWGTSDAAFVFFFGKAGLSPAIALAVCLLYRFFWYLTAAVGAVLYVARARRSGAIAVPESPGEP